MPIEIRYLSDPLLFNFNNQFTGRSFPKYDGMSNAAFPVPDMMSIARHNTREGILTCVKELILRVDGVEAHH